jgi:hypothetical protein
MRAAILAGPTYAALASQKFAMPGSRPEELTAVRFLRSLAVAAAAFPQQGHPVPVPC